MKLPVELRKTNEQFKVELHFDTFPEDEDKLLVFGNGDLLESAIKNITLNACKYSGDHTAIVGLNFSENELKIVVSDLGSGIKEEEQTLVFQPFFRSKSETNSEGFGLGLSLASRIIKLHKGDIQLTNNQPQGSIFTISLPIARKFHLI
jgi:signal transduction histidine kinase